MDDITLYGTTRTRRPSLDGFERFGDEEKER